MTGLSLMRILPQPPALPSEGEVIYQNLNLLTLPEAQMRRLRGRKLAMIFQDPMTSLNPVYTVGEQLMEMAQVHLDLYGKEAWEAALNALKDVAIPLPERRMNEYPHQLSGGMKQRIMIAMALMCEPDILIADEPTTALDVTTQAQVLELIRDLQKRKGTALLLITHDMGIVAEMADEVVVMYAAQAVERGSALAIFDQQAHPYTQGLFRCRPSLTGQPLEAIKGMVPPPNRFPQGCHFHPRCPYVMPRCKQGAVPNFEVEPAHEALCWLHSPEVKRGE
jgi:oligopeptide/dipeptide ABC transporter ATP-binding protein